MGNIFTVFLQVRARKIKNRVADRRGGRLKVQASETDPAFKSASSKAPNHAPQPRSLSFSSAEKILVVGDGDFSFSRGLVIHVGGSGENLVLTSYDTAEELASKYPQARANVDFVLKRGAVVRHGVDATRLEEAFPDELFDRIVFNFPHSGAIGRPHSRRICSAHAPFHAVP